MMRMRARDLATFCFQSALQVLSTGILSPCSGTETKSTKCDFGVIYEVPLFTFAAF